MKSDPPKALAARRRASAHPPRPTRKAAARACLVFALLLCLMAVAGRASADTQTQEPPPASPTPPPDIYSAVVVTEVSNANSLHREPNEEWFWTRWFNGLDAWATKQTPQNRKAGLGDQIVVTAYNLEALFLRAKCKPPYDKIQGCREQEIALFIDGRAIKGLKPESGAPTLTPSGSDNNERPPALCPDAPQWRQCRDGELHYHLQRITDPPDIAAADAEHWADLLGLHSSDPGTWSLERRVDVSVGLADEYPVRTKVNQDAPADMRFFLIRVRPLRLPFWILFLVALVWLMLRLSRRYCMLCDRRPVVWPDRRPYSLSAVQAAWWFFVILVVFLLIWLVTGGEDFSETALALLGIGAGTALGATVIDANKQRKDAADGADDDTLKTLLAEKKSLEVELDKQDKALKKASRQLASLKFLQAAAQTRLDADKLRQAAAQKQLDTDRQSNVADLKQREDAVTKAQDALNKEQDKVNEKQKEIDAKQNEIDSKQPEFDAKKKEYDLKIGEIKVAYPKLIGPPRETFLIDILSDAGGVSFHRLQMLVWTLVLSIFFFVSALGGLSMPNFSATLLGLMGLSAGTYLGFKIPENSGEPSSGDAGGGAGGGAGGDTPDPSKPAAGATTDTTGTKTTGGDAQDATGQDATGATERTTTDTKDAASGDATTQTERKPDTPAAATTTGGATDTGSAKETTATDATTIPPGTTTSSGTATTTSTDAATGTTGAGGTGTNPAATDARSSGGTGSSSTAVTDTAGGRNTSGAGSGAPPTGGSGAAGGTQASGTGTTESSETGPGDDSEGGESGGDGADDSETVGDAGGPAQGGNSAQ